MPKLRANIPLPIIGIDVGKPGEFLDSRSTPDCKNVEINRFQIAKRIGTTALGSSLGERVMAFSELASSSTTYFLRFGLTKVELLNKSDLTWSDVTGTALTGAVTDRFDFAFPLLSGSKIMTLTNGKDAIRKYTGSGNTAALGGSPPVAKFLLSFGTYLVLGNISGFPSRVQWSDTGTPETWSGGNAGSVDLVEDPEDITGLGVFGGFITVHKTNSIYVGYLVTTSDVFRFDRKATGSGAVAHATIKNLPTGEQIFLSRDGIRLFNGVTAPLIQSPIIDELRESVNPEYVYKAWGQIVREKDEYWCAVPIGNATEPNTVYKYNYATGQCYKDERENICACGLYESTTQSPWDGKSNTWDSDTSRWDSITYLKLNPIVAFGGTSGATTYRDEIFSDNSTAISSYWISKDYVAQDYGSEQFGQLIRWTALQVWAKGNNLQVDYSIDEGLSWTNITTLELESNYPADDSPLYCYFDVVSSKIRFRFLNSTAGESFTIKKFFIEAMPREMRQ